MKEGFTVLDSSVSESPDHGHIRRTYVKGEHLSEGVVQEGWEGPETVVTEHVIRAIKVFEVRDGKN